MSLTVGNAVVHAVPEHQFTLPLSAITQDRELLTRYAGPLGSAFMDPQTDTFTFSNHSWVIEVDDITVLVDPCTGNGRTGLGPLFDGLDTPYLERLRDSGSAPEDVDIVFSTHLHHDHCGWNTTESSEGRWHPTFPRASYVLVREEYDRWDPAQPGHPNEFNPSVFEQCVRPVIDAGLSTIVSTPHRVSPSLTVEPAPGHTPGHSLLRLASAGQVALFTGDAFHHPIQLTRPALHLNGCDDLESAIRTREIIVARALDEDALLFPAHFPATHYGSLRRDGDAVAFVLGS
jgi:glyoxylase-like metal-dependent hydrolase (beta-lactamase superfamily II)